VLHIHTHTHTHTFPEWLAVGAWWHLTAALLSPFKDSASTDDMW